MKSMKKGFSLIELLLVLGVIAALSIGAFFVYGLVNDGLVVSKNKAKIIETVMILENISNAIAASDSPNKGQGYIGDIADYYAYFDPADQEFVKNEGAGRLPTGERLNFNYSYEAGAEGDYTINSYQTVNVDFFEGNMTETQCVKFLGELYNLKPAVFNIGGGAPRIKISEFEDICKDKSGISFGVNPSGYGG